MPERGFTLLEIMLVIFFIGLASAGVVQTFATDSESPAKKAATASCNLPTCAAMKTASTPGSPLGCGPSLFSMASTIPAIPKSITITRLPTW